MNMLDFARTLALVPQLAARSAPVVGLAGFYGLVKRLPVHVSEHQYRAGVGIAGDRRYQAVAVEFRCKLNTFFNIAALVGGRHLDEQLDGETAGRRAYQFHEAGLPGWILLEFTGELSGDR